MQISKYDIILVDLRLILGSEINGVRPCLVMQNNLINKYSCTTVISYFTYKIRDFPHYMVVEPSNLNKLTKRSALNLLQVRTIDKGRIIKKIGVLDSKYFNELKMRFTDVFDLEDMFLNFNKNA